MTERRREAVARAPDQLRIGPSMLAWDGDTLVMEIDELAAPIPRPVRGHIRVEPLCIGDTGFGLDPEGRHRWQPIAPRARISVALDRPALRWEGDAYFDANFGDEALEDGFREWTWSRAHLRSDTLVLYEGVRRDKARFDMALRFGCDGRWQDVVAPPRVTLPRTRFAMPRMTHADHGADAFVRHSWEDTPFYARSLVTTRLQGQKVHVVQESLNLDRFRSPLILAMLPYRMPRASAWSTLAAPIAPLLAR